MFFSESTLCAVLVTSTFCFIFSFSNFSALFLFAIDISVTGSSIVIVYVLSKTRTLVVWIKYSIFINSQGSERYNY